MDEGDKARAAGRKISLFAWDLLAGLADESLKAAGVVVRAKLEARRDRRAVDEYEGGGRAIFPPLA